jgi:hypothetical protein
MVEFLISLIPVCLGIWTIHILFQEGHLLENAGTWMDVNFPVKINKPLWACTICMSSVHGLIGFFAIRFFFGVDLPLKQLIPFIFCLCGLNVIISKLVNKERVIVEE